MNLHHITYERKGVEREEDLCWLCRTHHESVHRLVEEGIPLSTAHLVYFEMYKSRMNKTAEQKECEAKEFDGTLEQIGRETTKPNKPSKPKPQLPSRRSLKQSKRKKALLSRKQSANICIRGWTKVDDPLAGTKTSQKKKEPIKKSTTQKWYREYLKSKEWKLRKKAYAKKNPQKCFVCGVEADIALHHISYANIGAERDCDLCWCCGLHHAEVHRMISAGIDNPQVLLKKRHEVGKR